MNDEDEQEEGLVIGAFLSPQAGHDGSQPDLEIKPSVALSTAAQTRGAASSFGLA